jgi:hypothetical protein
VKNQSREHAKKVEYSSTFMACPRAARRTKKAQVKQEQRKFSNVCCARAGKATAMENGHNTLGCAFKRVFRMVNISFQIHWM